jgi:hypothetical protein
MELNTGSALTFEQVGNVAEDVYLIYDANANSFDYISPAFEKVWGHPSAAYMQNAEALIQTVHSEDKSYFHTTIRPISTLLQLLLLM